MKIRKAILTGGGRGTRLHPITTTLNKHLIPLANKPMIFHAIEKVVAAGVNKIYINTNPGDTELQKYIGDGGHWGVDIYYFEQRGGALGIAHAVNEAKEFIGNDPFIFYLSDNILFGDISPMVKEFEENKHDLMLALSRVEDPQRFGVAVFDDKGILVDVVEKPDVPPSDLAVTGIYLYGGGGIFFDTFDKIQKSERGEYEISDIHSLFLKEGKNVGYKEITGWWKDTGKPSDLLLANKLLLQHFKEFDTQLSDQHKIATIVGDVKIGLSSRIGDNVTLIGPVIIGENCSLENCTIGPDVTIGAGSDIKGITINHSIILEHAIIHSDISITESLIGKKVTIGKATNDQKAHRMIIGDKTVIEL